MPVLRSASLLVAICLGVLLADTADAQRRASDRGAGYGDIVENRGTRGSDGGAGAFVCLGVVGVIVVGFLLLSVRENWRNEREIDKRAKATIQRDSTPEGRSARFSAKSEARRRGEAKASEAQQHITSLLPAQQSAASQKLYAELAARLGKQALAAFKSKQPDTAATALHELASARRRWFDREEKPDPALGFFMDQFINDQVAQKYGRYPVDKKMLALDSCARKALGPDFILLEGNVRPGRLRMHFPHAVPRGKDPVLFGIAADVRDDFDAAFRQEQKRQSKAQDLKKLA